MNLLRGLKAAGVAFATIFSGISLAAGPSFTGIDKAELEEIINDFSAVVSHTSVAPASSLGTIFGIELGIIGGSVKTPSVERLAKEADPNSSVDSIPHFAILGAVSVPFGITVEANYVPEIDTTDLKLSNMSMALKWTMTDTLVDFGPFDLAFKAHMTNSTIGFKQDIGGYPADVEFTDKITGFMLIGSMDFVVVEPYVGIGTLSADGELSYSGGSGTIFDAVFPGQSASANPTGSHFIMGVQANLLIFKLGVEYANLFNTNRIDTKFSLKF